MFTDFDPDDLTRLDKRFPHRASVWKLRRSSLTFERLPRLMGIVNVTPDSFSDGGRYLSSDDAVGQALRLIEEGADLIDIGGESTRPYAAPVSAEDELRRVIPVVEKVCRLTNVPVSIDTSKAVVAQAALDAGAQVINDVTGLCGDPQMVATALRNDAGVCAMHMQGTPQNMQDDPHYDDVVEDIGRFLQQRRDGLLEAGIDRERVCLDPGIGFGKTHQHNLTLLANCHRYHKLGHPLLIGHSRKGFIGKLLNGPTANRTSATVGVALSMAQRGIQVLRVHEVRPVREALLLFDAVGGIDGQEVRLD